MVLSVAMKKTFHYFGCLFVLTLVLISQVSSTLSHDGHLIVIEEASESWFLSADPNDDVEGLVTRIFTSPADIQYSIAIIAINRPVFRDLLLRPETRAPPFV